jgi:hypothetical protein
MDDTPLETQLLDRAASRQRRVPDRVRMVVAILVVAAWILSPVASASAASVEAKVKSAYLYNLLRRTTWPDTMFKNDESPYRIIVLGRDNLDGLLEKIAQMKKVNKRSIKLERIKSLDEYNEREPCHMLYVPEYDLSPEKQQAILKKTAGTPCLVVGDSPGFARAGAMANFMDREDGTIGLELNLARAKKHRIKFDKQLIEVSQTVAE